MIKQQLHEKILQNELDLKKWFNEKSKFKQIPFYTSFDIRDSGEKISLVDGNVFPSGFNNICKLDQEDSLNAINTFFKNKNIKTVGIICENNSQRSFYWESVAVLKELIEKTGIKVSLFPSFPNPKSINFNTFMKKNITLLPYKKENSEIITENKIDYYISNNDFSEENSYWDKSSFNPGYKMGWQYRKKSKFFSYYNDLINEFAKIINIDPFLLNIKTKKITNFNVQDESSLKELNNKANDFFIDLNNLHKKYKFKNSPYFFIKNNSGTYGMGVISLDSPEKLFSLNSKEKNKMKKMKGGKLIDEIIIQEGIPSHLKHNGTPAEPTIYMVGAHPIGGFLRTHPKKNTKDSLNSPGAIFEKLCLSDLKVNISDHPTENVYCWIARIGFLCVCKEMNHF